MPAELGASPLLDRAQGSTPSYCSKDAWSALQLVWLLLSTELSESSEAISAAASHDVSFPTAGSHYEVLCQKGFRVGS